MKQVRLTVAVIGISAFALLTLTGCDLIAKPRKTTRSSRSASSAPAAVPAKTPAATPAAVETSRPPATGDAQPLPAGVLAKVGDWSITQDEFNERLKGVTAMVKDIDVKSPETRAMLLNELVRQQLMVQQARRDRLQESKEVQAAMVDFENTLLVQEFVNRLTKGIEVTEAEAKKYYDEHPDEFRKPVEKQLREIVVATQEEANQTLVQVLQGADFAQTAKDKSRAKTRDNGGDLGFRAEAPFRAMAAATATLKTGGISSVFEGPEGFYIVKVEGIRGGDLALFADVKADLIKFLTLRQQKKVLEERIDMIQQQIKVQVNTDLLKAGTGE